MSKTTFRSDERGTMSYLGIYMSIAMLAVGGIGIDLMMTEMRRAKLQATLDRAVLAAAHPDSRGATNGETEATASAIVLDYVNKTGYADYLDAPQVTASAASTYVRATGSITSPSNFLSLLGFDTLQATAFAAAEDITANTEISMVLDISGSMRFNDRIGHLREAAVDFVDTVLAEDAANITSINLVPYAGMTNPGPVMFDYLGGLRYATDTGLPQVSSCKEMDAGDFTSRGLPTSQVDQVPHFMNWNIAADVMDWGWCPQDATAIRYASNDRAALGDMIRNMRMHDGTGTHYAMKWGVSLLDPISQPAFDHLAANGQIPAEFIGRPAPFNMPGSRKIIVLMTDGIITEQVRPTDPLDPENATRELRRQPGSNTSRITSASENVGSFYTQCQQAKDNGVIVYTIAYEAPGAAATQMETCASSPSHFFEVEGLEITEAFGAIARQIRQLRLVE